MSDIIVCQRKKNYKEMEVFEFTGHIYKNRIIYNIRIYIKE